MKWKKDKGGYSSRRRYANYWSRRGRWQYEKGHLFEHVVEEYFSNLGYEVKRNQFLTAFPVLGTRLTWLFTRMAGLSGS